MKIQEEVKAFLKLARRWRDTPMFLGDFIVMRDELDRLRDSLSDRIKNGEQDAITSPATSGNEDAVSTKGWEFDPPIHVTEGCMGECDYWSAWGRKGNVSVCGSALTPAEALAKCRENAAKKDAEPPPAIPELTIREAQKCQPWTVPYSLGVRRAEEEYVGHILGTHCVLHAAKSVGKLASVFEALDHDDKSITPKQVATVKDMAADLMTAALRFANLYGFDLSDELERRVLDKNGVPIRNK